MLNFVALIETSIGFRLETITRPDYESAVDLAYPLDIAIGISGLIERVLSRQD